MMPDFVIIGAMKCATSTLHDQLARVEGVSMSEPKEPNFFSDEGNWARGLEWYESLFSTMPEGDLKGESSTHYTKLPTYPDAAHRFHTHLPNAQLIYVMRDPIDRLVSQYIHEWSQRVIEADCTIDHAIDVHSPLVEYSMYAMQLKPYIELYGQERILPVFFERLMAQPQQEFERIGRFLGISTPMCWEPDEAKNVSAQRQRRGPFLDAVLRVPLFQRLRRMMMPESMRERIRSRWTMQERPELSASSIQKLQDQLDPDIRQLGEMLGIELDCSTFKAKITQSNQLDWKRVVSA